MRLTTFSGRGRTPTQLPPGFLAAANLTATQDQYFLRDAPLNALDGVAFHYSVYRSLTRFLGMDGNLDVAYDTDVNFVTAWNQMFVTNDFLNPNTGVVDPRHLLGTSNFDVFRWPSLVNGTQLSVLGTFITSLVVPGIPLVCIILIYTHPQINHYSSFIMAKSRTFMSTTRAPTTTFMGMQWFFLSMLWID
jgi:alpha-1,3-glucan synthase